MLELINHSHFTADLYNGFDQSNKHQLTCVIKASWQFDQAGNLTPMKSPQPIEEVDCYYTEPDKSSMKAANEIMPSKHGSEILLYGTVYPTSEKSYATEASIKIERSDDKVWQKTLYVFGPRKWQSFLMGYIPGKPAIFQPLLLRYEYAYGGQDPKGKQSFYSLNPTGMGFTESNGAKDLFMPQIENTKLINKITDRPIPAGFGPMPATWKKDKTNSKVEKLFSTNMAPEDQRFDAPFIGGEKITLKNLIAGAANKTVMLIVPKIKPRLQLYLNEDMQGLEPVCDTVVIDTDKKFLNMIWRCGINWEIEDQSHGILLLRVQV